MVAMKDSSGAALAVRRLTGWEPLGFEAGDNNWYRFVANEPTEKTDPSGLYEPDDEFAGIPLDVLLPLPTPPTQYSPCKIVPTDEYGLPVSGPLRAGAIGTVYGGSQCANLPEAKRLAKELCQQTAIDAALAILTAGFSARSLAMFGHAVQPYKTSTASNVARALTKHPNIVGVSAPAGRVSQALIAKFGCQQGVNNAAAEALAHIMQNGKVTQKTTKAFGEVIDLKLPNGLGARFNAVTNEFICFLGRGL